MIIFPHFKFLYVKLKKRIVFCLSVFGTFEDIPAQDFFDVQRDTEYRKRWDGLVIKLDIVDSEKIENISNILTNDNPNEVNSQNKNNHKAYLDSGNEVIHWIMHYPVSYDQLLVC